LFVKLKALSLKSNGNGKLFLVAKLESSQWWTKVNGIMSKTPKCLGSSKPKPKGIVGNQLKFGWLIMAKIPRETFL